MHNRCVVESRKVLESDPTTISMYVTVQYSTVHVDVIYRMIHTFNVLSFHPKKLR